MPERNRPHRATPPGQAASAWPDLIFTKWRPRLNDSQFLLFLGMALHASHKTDPPTFEGHWEQLAWMLGKVTPPLPAAFDESPEAARARQDRDNHYESTRRLIRGLIDAGAVRVLRPRALGRVPIYGLYITTEPGPECERWIEDPGWIYYLQFADRIKIGYARDVKRRLKRYPPGSELLATHRGTLAEEAALHERFREHRIAGREWFAVAPEIMEHVATLG